MSQIKDLLVDELKDLLHAETQLINALPNMAEAAHHPKLKEAFEKHLEQTRNQVERLKQVFEMLGEPAEPKTCRAMAGLIEEGEEKIEEGQEKPEIAADLALITAAQKVEHYEISGYGTARTLAWQLNEREAARLLGYNLGEEESTDYLLTEVSKPLLQQALLDETGGEKAAGRKTSRSAASHKQE